MYKIGEIISNRCLKGDYYQAVFYNPEIAAKAIAGQFRSGVKTRRRAGGD